jgi:hypothetical protein
LGLVCEALRAAGRWPVALPALLRVAQRQRFGRIAMLAQAAAADPDLHERVGDHDQALQERTTQGQLDGSLRALEVVAGQAWRHVLTPTEHGAVPLPAAMAAAAVVQWKTHVEDIKEEAETITTLALADVGAAAGTLPDSAQWVLLLDESGSALQGRAGARGRTDATGALKRRPGARLRPVDLRRASSDRQRAPARRADRQLHQLRRAPPDQPGSRDWLAKLPTGLGDAFAHYGRIFKTLHVLQFLHDESYRRMIGTQLNVQEARHRLARRIFFGQRGGLRQAYGRAWKINSQRSGWRSTPPTTPSSSSRRTALP